MRRLVRISICTCLLATVFAAVPAMAADGTWIEVRSEHFTVITDAGEKNGTLVAERFEQMRTVFGELFGRQKINQPVPLDIIAFRNTKEIRQYSPLFHGKVVELSGFFQQADDKDFVAVDMSREESWQTVYHEYAHILLNSNFQATAPWFDEGFAEYLSSMKVSPGDIQIGQPTPDSVLLLQGNKLRLLDLFQVQHHSETYNVNGERREMFYVQSWLVVHYLFDNNRIAEAAKYFHLTNDQKMPVPQAIQAAFGATPEEFEKTILNYLRAGKVRVLRYTGKEKVALTYATTSRPLGPLETRARLADLHLHSPDYSSVAIKDFEEILKTDPNQVEAQRSLGYAYLSSGQPDKAAEHFHAAARLGSKDARVYFYSAVLMQENNPATMASPELQQDLRRALELDPQYSDAYALLGESLVTAGHFAEGEQNLRRAMELSPRNEMYRLNYALALLNEQKIEEAQSLLAAAANSSDPGTAQRAGQALRQIEEYKVGRSRQQAAKAATAPTVEVESARGPEPAAEPITNVAAVQYLKGTLMAVDCASPPAAWLTVVAGSQTWKMKVPNTEHAIVIGEDKFSCSWGKKKVGLNYRATGTAEGSVISLEIQ